jgi:hypothetical protein
VGQLLKSSEDRIETLGGRIVPGTAEQVHRFMIHAGRYIPQPAE